MIERIVLISGTPGTGKTTVSKYINKNYDIQYLSLSDIVQKNNLYEAIDEERDTKIVDPDKLDDFIEDYIKNHEGDLIIDAHYADMVIHPAVKLGVILRCHPVELEKRLNARNYSEKKKLENIQAEMVSSSGSYMLDNEILKDGNKIFEIDSSKYSIEEIGEIIASLFIKNAKYQNLKTINEEKYRFGKISWLSDKSLPLNFFTS